MANFTKEELEKDVEFLSQRAEKANSVRFDDFERDTGASSNSIVSIAYGIRTIDEQELPYDQSDLNACERMWRQLPSHRKNELATVAMARARNELSTSKTAL